MNDAGTVFKLVTSSGTLTQELQHATKMVNAGKINGTIGNLGSFISEVEDLENSGLLTCNQAASLVNPANAVVEQLQAS